MTEPVFHSPRSKGKAAALLLAAVLVLVLILDRSGALAPYQLKTLDALFLGAPLPAASPQVVVVTVDQPDLDFFKEQGVTWPWPRQAYRKSRSRSLGTGNSYSNSRHERVMPSAPPF